MLNVALAYGTGSSMSDAGNSALQILNNGHSVGDGIYWIDPNGGGTDDAFQTFSDMTYDDGGWTAIKYPTMAADAPGWAIDILITNSTSSPSVAEILFYDDHGSIFSGELNNLNGGSWDDAFLQSSNGKDGTLWFNILNDYNMVFIRADSSANYSSNPVPVPATILLLGSGLIGLVGIRRKLKKA